MSKAPKAKASSPPAQEPPVTEQEREAVSRDIPPGIEETAALSGEPRTWNIWQKMFFVQQNLKVGKNRGKGHGGTVGYEIPFTRHFYEYTPLRPSAEILAEIRELEASIASRLEGVLQ